MLPSDLTTTSFGRFSFRPRYRSAMTVMLPSASSRSTQRLKWWQTTSRPCRSRVMPLALAVPSLSSEMPLPGSHFMRRLPWMSLNRR